MLILGLLLLVLWAIYRKSLLLVAAVVLLIVSALVPLGISVPSPYNR